MRPQTLVHLSDLHVGRDAADDDATAALAASLAAAGADHVVVTGDITHRGRRREWAAFRHAFRPLARAGRLTIVPGNHDRLTDDVGSRIMAGARVQVVERPGLYLVRVDSTGPHNRSRITGHGILGTTDIEDCRRALAAAPRGVLAGVLLHHHPLPLPEEDLAERVASWCGRPWATELPLGACLVERVTGLCDLVLHGHRHVPSDAPHAEDTGRPLSICNAGATPRLGRFRVFVHRAGVQVREPRWIESAGRAAGLEPLERSA